MTQQHSLSLTPPIRPTQPTPNKDKDKNQAERPQILLLGNSHTTNINDRGICMGADTTKVLTYTSEEAKTFLTNSDIRNYACIILHLITNDIKNTDEETTTNNMKELITMIENKAPNAKIIVSLAPERKDSTTLNQSTTKVNEQLERWIKTRKEVIACPHTNLPNPLQDDWTKYFNRDGVHLSNIGTSILASNIRRTTESALKIKSSRNKNTPKDTIYQQQPTDTNAYRRKWNNTNYAYNNHTYKDYNNNHPNKDDYNRYRTPESNKIAPMNEHQYHNHRDGLGYDQDHADQYNRNDHHFGQPYQHNPATRTTCYTDNYRDHNQHKYEPWNYRTDYEQSYSAPYHDNYYH